MQRIINEIGERVVSVRSVPQHGGYSYVAAGVYECRQARAGHLYWAIVGDAGPDRRSRKLAEQDAIAYGEEHNLKVQLGVRHGKRAFSFADGIQRVQTAVCGA